MIDRNPASRIRRKTECGGRVRLLSDAEEGRLRVAIGRRCKEFFASSPSVHPYRDADERAIRPQMGPGRLRTPSNSSPQDQERAPADDTPELDRRRRPRGTRGWGHQSKGNPGLPFRSEWRVSSGISWLVPGALEEAKIEQYSWHCNRHTFASRLVMAGVDLRTVAELLGHRTLQMVMRYSHLAPEHQAAAVDRLVPGEDQRDTRSDTNGLKRGEARRMNASNR
jgi:Phage integrase family